MKLKLSKITKSINRNKFFLALISILVGYFILIPILKSSQMNIDQELTLLTDCADTQWGTSDQINIDESTSCPSLIDVYFAIANIDPVVERNISAKIQLFPSGAYGGAVANGGWTAKSIELTYEGTDETNWQLLSNTLIGSRAVEINLSDQAALYKYPFDKYATSWTSRLEDDVMGEPIPIVMSASQRKIDGFDVEIVASRNSETPKLPRAAFIDGIYKIEIAIKRSTTSIFLTLLLGSIMIAGALASLVMTSFILTKKRPPSLASLGWLATFLFALIEIRQNIPGGPPLGIGFDSYVTFPVVIIMMLSMLFTGVNWIIRDDWDLKNVANR
jgi:hypothetical protein